MKNNPIYQSGKPLVAGHRTGRRFIVILVIVLTIVLAGGFLGSGLNVQADTEVVPTADDLQLVTPAAADNARDLADEVRKTVLCPEGESELVCAERAPDQGMQIPLTGE